MRCFQVEYTSCRLGESTGFQVRAATPHTETAIGQEDMDEVIRHGLFRPPLDGRDPAPVAFRAIKLSSGRQVLQFSRYLGLDDTGREGNFRTLSLVAEHAGTALPLWAMDYYEWTGWEKTVPAPDPAQQCAELPLPLPLVRLQDIQPGESFAYAELAQFLQENPNRFAWLMTMLAAMFRPVTHRRLVVRDEKENNPYWLACLTKLLPRSVANNLHISTHQPDSRGFDLAAVPPHCEVESALLFEPGPHAPKRLEAIDPLLAIPPIGHIYAKKNRKPPPTSARSHTRLFARYLRCYPICLEQH